MGRRTLQSLLLAAALVLPTAAQSQSPTYSPLPFPEVNVDTGVLVEVWPDVSDITLSAYFMDYSSRRNEGLCEATKRALDRDAAVLSAEQGCQSASNADPRSASNFDPSRDGKRKA